MSARLARSRGLDAWVRRWWTGQAGLPGLALSVTLFPAEALFRVGVTLRDHGFRRGWLTSKRASIPVISVGNLVVGGTGKTPVTSWLAQELVARGHRPAVVVRGYGRDEIELHRRWFPEVPVIPSRRRLDGAQAAARDGRTLVLLDDGFQHRRLERDVDIVLLAAEDRLPPRLLPRGPYREPLSALQRADVIIITRKSASRARAREVEDILRTQGAKAPVCHLHLTASGWSWMDGSSCGPPPGPVLAVSAIGRPETFVALLREQGCDPVKSLPFPDHHEYDESDVARILEERGEAQVVVTEKDAVKLRPFSQRLGEVRVLRLAVAVDGDRQGLDVLWELIRSNADLDGKS